MAIFMGLVMAMGQLSSGTIITHNHGYSSRNNITVMVGTMVPS